MKRVLLIAVCSLAAGAAAAIVPAVIGLAGNRSVDHQVPLRTPNNARPAVVVVAHNAPPARERQKSEAVDERVVGRDERARVNADRERGPERAEARRDGEPGEDNRGGREAPERTSRISDDNHSANDGRDRGEPALDDSGGDG